MMADSTLKPRKSSRPNSNLYEEEIVVKPSTELISDEYVHLSPDQIPAVHIFTNGLYEDKSDELITELANSFEAIRYRINEHYFDHVEDFENDLKSVKQSLATASALILIFLGVSKEDESSYLLSDRSGDQKVISLMEIWNHFAASNCLELKEKPKIFIFCNTQLPSTVQSDTRKINPEELTEAYYDFPAESDILIIYKKNTTDEIRRFLLQFCENINKYSNKYDIIDLLHHTTTKTKIHSPAPVTISTLTRKFFLCGSDYRDKYLTLFENMTKLETAIEKLAKCIEDLHRYEQKKKEKKPFFSSSFSSFRRKVDEKPKIEKKGPSRHSSRKEEEKKRVENDAPQPILDKKLDVEESQPSPSRKSSITPLPRSRTTSGISKSDMIERNRASGKNQDKPRWRN